MGNTIGGKYRFLKFGNAGQFSGGIPQEPFPAAFQPLHGAAKADVLHVKAMGLVVWLYQRHPPAMPGE